MLQIEVSIFASFQSLYLTKCNAPSQGAVGVNASVFQLFESGWRTSKVNKKGFLSNIVHL